MCQTGTGIWLMMRACDTIMYGMLLPDHPSCPPPCPHPLPTYYRQAYPAAPQQGTPYDKDQQEIIDRSIGPNVSIKSYLASLYCEY